MNQQPLAHVQYEKNGNVLTIQMDWPEKKNAMDWKMMESLISLFTQAQEDRDVKVIVLKGSAGFFNTGGYCNTADPEEKAHYNRALSTLTKTQSNLSLPLIAAVNGDCLAGGMMILARADFAIAQESAQFGFPEILHGAFPMVVMSPLVDVFPRKKALEVFCSGENFSATQAEKMGLLNQVVPENDLDAAVQRFIDMICRVDRDVMRIGRKCYHDMCRLPEEERDACGLRALQEVWAARDAAEKNKR